MKSMNRKVETQKIYIWFLNIKLYESGVVDGWKGGDMWFYMKKNRQVSKNTWWGFKNGRLDACCYCLFFIVCILQHSTHLVIIYSDLVPKLLVNMQSYSNAFIFVWLNKFKFINNNYRYLKINSKYYKIRMLILNKIP